jgi:hypothetical protein
MISRKRNRILNFLLKYWVIIAGLCTGIFTIYQVVYSKPDNKQEISNIRQNYTQLLSTSSKIIAALEYHQNIDSPSIEFEEAYGNFVPLKEDKLVFNYVRDFRLELMDFKIGRSNLEKLSYRQRCLLTSITKELKRLQY